MSEKCFLLLSRLSFWERRNVTDDLLLNIDQETPERPQCFCCIFFCIFEHFVQLISNLANLITWCPVDHISHWTFGGHPDYRIGFLHVWDRH